MSLQEILDKANKHAKTNIFNFYIGDVEMNDVKNEFKGTVYGGAITNESGTVITNTYANSEDNKNIVNNIVELKKLLLACKEIDSADVIDDLDLVMEQVQLEQPRISWIKSAMERVSGFIKNIPENLELAEKITNTATVVFENIDKIALAGATIASMIK